MKRFALSTLSLALLGTAGVAHAQSSVTLYGVLDDSIQYVSNVQGHSLWNMAAGNLQGNRWGMKGSEDLGGGLKAIFQLENGFNPNNGKASQGNRMFGRQAYVGLSGNSWGTATVGRQYDPVVDLVQPLTADNYWGSTFTTAGDVDNNDNSSRTNNSIKYTSPVWGGFQFEGMYALGGVAGSTGSGQTWAGAATYATGPFAVAAGYIRMDNLSSAVPRGGWSTSATSDGTFDSIQNSAYQSAKSIGIASVALQYVAGPFTFGGRYSNAQYKPDAQSGFGTTEKYDVGAGFVNYQLTPAALLGFGYTYTHGKGDSNATYHQISLGGDYNLSKRTDVYLVGAYQHANGNQRNDAGSLQSSVASVADYGFSSSSDNQTIVSLGIRHKF
ncbi:MAG: porin [Paraburkholderia sp.]|uniref:porin n=1 Tax=Paraburkholderia sp. TaxID=1926495 RepID=UPI0011F7C420|nr:porin [Paraburkholderia sp.]TAL97788.1 MAG: porin [Paraburkholderia sp.]